MTCQQCGEAVPFEPTICPGKPVATKADYQQFGRYIAPKLDDPAINKLFSFIDLLELCRQHPRVEPTNLLRRLKSSATSSPSTQEKGSPVGVSSSHGGRRATKAEA